MTTIAVLIGSLSASSINLKYAKALAKLASPLLEFDFVDLSALPHYNNDLWANPPAAVLDLKRKIEAADGVLIVTPEYNRSFSAVIKTALEWGSRPWGKSSWGGKPVAVTGTSGGAIGTAVAQTQLRVILPHLDMVLMGQPEIFLKSSPELIDAEFNITSPETKALLLGFVQKFAAFVERHGDHAVKLAAE
ncbi:NADPH-dependent FMN reductase [Devosia sp. A449]